MVDVAGYRALIEAFEHDRVALAVDGDLDVDAVDAFDEVPS